MKNQEFTERIQKRLFDLELEVAKSDEFIKLDKKLEEALSKIKDNLPGELKCLADMVDEYFTEMLLIHEEHFYTKGLRDSNVLTNLRSALRTAMLGVK